MQAYGYVDPFASTRYTDRQFIIITSMSATQYHALLSLTVPLLLSILSLFLVNVFLPYYKIILLFFLISITYLKLSFFLQVINRVWLHSSL